MRDEDIHKKKRVVGAYVAALAMITVSGESCLLPDREPKDAPAGAGGAAGALIDGGAGRDTSAGGSDGSGAAAGKDSSSEQGGNAGSTSNGGSSGIGGGGAAGAGGISGSSGSSGIGGVAGSPAGNGGAAGGTGGTVPFCYEPGSHSYAEWDCLQRPADGGCCDERSACDEAGSGFCCFPKHFDGCTKDKECCTSQCGTAGESKGKCCDSPGTNCLNSDGGPDNSYCCSNICGVAAPNFGRCVAP